MARRLLAAFYQHRNGNVSIIAALALPALVGFVSLVAEFGHGLSVQTQNQRVADAAAFAGALAYATTSSTATMTAAAQSVAALNGLPASAISASLTPSPRTSGSNAVLVNVSTSNMLFLAPLLRYGTSLPVRAKAYAEIGAAGPACMIALNASGTGVTMAGGSAINATLCAVASNTSLTVPCGTAIAAQTVRYAGLAPTQPCNGITGNLANSATTDPLAGLAGVTTLKTHAATLPLLTAPALPPLSLSSLYALFGPPDVDFGYSIGATTTQVAKSGCTAAYASNVWTVTCAAGTAAAFGNFTVEGGITVNFATSGASSNSYTITGTLTNNGTALNLGPGSFTIAKGIATGGGSRTSFAAGSYTVGAMANACNGAGRYSLCNLGTSTTFASPSTFSFIGGVYNNGGSTLILGAGPGNTLTIGPASDGNAVFIGGGATTTLAETDSNTFQLVGNFLQAGGACTTFGIADAHDIVGDLSTAGGTVMGAGIYAVSGYIAIGANGGGDVSCAGSSVGVSGSGVVLVTLGLDTWLGGNCNGTAFCIGSGFSNVLLSAPTSGTLKNLLLIGPPATTGSAIFTEGATNTLLAGAIYFPAGALALSGGANVGYQNVQCLQMIATQIALSGGTQANVASCFTDTSATSSVALVQ